MDSGLLVACGFVGILFIALVIEHFLLTRYVVMTAKVGVSMKPLKMRFRTRAAALECMQRYSRPGWLVMVFDRHTPIEERYEK